MWLVVGEFLVIFVPDSPSPFKPERAGDFESVDLKRLRIVRMFGDLELQWTLRVCHLIDLTGLVLHQARVKTSGVDFELPILVLLKVLEAVLKYVVFSPHSPRRHLIFVRFRRNLFRNVIDEVLSVAPALEIHLFCVVARARRVEIFGARVTSVAGEDFLTSL